jgi:glycosyltransferase involved in cell wall biosynthesis
MFNTITLLITHYNRSQSLQRLLQTFKSQGIQFGDIVVSDDGSKPEHLDKLKEIAPQYNFRLITTPKNAGLGNNINKGQDAVTTPYTLYVQEDFDPLPGYAQHLQDALDILNERQDIDMARFYAYYKYPYLKPIRKGFSEMIFNFGAPGYRKFHYYSDHPHLRRDTFFKKFGRYAEGYNIEKGEFMMTMSFLKNKGKAIFYDDINGLFDQLNTAAEPSTMKRNNLKLSGNPLIVFVRDIYRHLKYNYDYLKAKKIEN